MVRGLRHIPALGGVCVQDQSAGPHSFGNYQRRRLHWGSEVMEEGTVSLLPRVRAGSRGSNDLDTPEEAVRYLLPYLPPPLLSIWEPCPGNHAMTRALEKVSGLDVVETTFDFLSSFILENGYDVIVTNPPFSKK